MLLCVPNFFTPYEFPVKVHKFVIFPIHTTVSAHRILRDLMT